MSKSRRRIIIDLYPQPHFGPQGIYVYSNYPALRLDEEEEHIRHDTQKGKLPSKKLPTDDLIFGASLEWAYRGYIVHRLSVSDDGTDQGALPVGIVPIAAVDQDTRSKQLEAIRADGSPGVPLYLFNVIVALEWEPSERFLQQLAWGFRNASNFLYDVTDGHMAFGQVIFGGIELMECADVQMMASNRLLPRSWVSGLHNKEKYMPIRIGRGVWHKHNRVSIPWDEPEAYRTLIHEWGHYALELKDEYLEVRAVALATQRKQLKAGEAVLAAQDSASDGRSRKLIDEHPRPIRVLSRVWKAPDQTAPLEQIRGGLPITTTLTGMSKTSTQDDPQLLVLPQISLSTQSIMATLEGTSELIPIPLSTGTSRERKRRVWQDLIDKQKFPLLRPDHKPLDGPGWLPMPLPRTQRLGALAGTPQGDELILDAFPHDIRFEHCWVYLLRGSNRKPERLIAQGTIDARSEQDGFLLLGARQDDTVLLIGESTDYEPVVLRGHIRDVVDNDGDRHAVIEWESNPIAPKTAPLIDVIPAKVQPTDRHVRISVQITPEPEYAWVFPLGQAKPKSINGKSIQVNSLDGHVLAFWKDGSLTINTYSQGGGPNSNVPVNASPTTAGSSEGNVMVFFEDNDPRPDFTEEERRERNGEIRIVTTLIHGMPNRLPSGAQARGYAFSLCSNIKLAPEFNSTLIMYFDTANLSSDGDLLIHRLDNNEWKPVPTYLRAGASYAAAALNDPEVGGTLVDDRYDGPRVERYRLYWTPHNP